MLQVHAAQHVRRLGELDVVVADDLDAIAPRVEKIEKPARQHIDSRVSQRLADGLLVVDHKPEVAAIVGGLGPTFLKREELVAQIDEGRGVALAPKLEIEQSAVEGQSLFDVTDLERDMIETNGACFSWPGHGTLRLLDHGVSMAGTATERQAVSTTMVAVRSIPDRRRPSRSLRDPRSQTDWINRVIETRHHDRGGIVAVQAQLFDGIVGDAAGQKLTRILDDKAQARHRLC